MRNIYELATFSQGACNLAALVRSWAEIVKVLQEEARANQLGGEWINKHPVNVLFAEQIYHLTGNGSMYTQSYAECVSKSANGQADLPTPGAAARRNPKELLDGGQRPNHTPRPTGTAENSLLPPMF